MHPCFCKWQPILFHCVHMYWNFPGGTGGKEPACQCRRHRRLRLDPWVGKIRWWRAWQPSPMSCLENSMDKKALWATVYWVTKSRTPLKRPSPHTHTCISSSLFICFIHLLCSSVDKHFSHFHILAVVNKVAINMGMQISFLYPVIISLGYMPRVRLWII